jgi:hypothetical protein
VWKKMFGRIRTYCRIRVIIQRAAKHCKPPNSGRIGKIPALFSHNSLNRDPARELEAREPLQWVVRQRKKCAREKLSFPYMGCLPHINGTTFPLLSFSSAEKKIRICTTSNEPAAG